MAMCFIYNAKIAHGSRGLPAIFSWLYSSRFGFHSVSGTPKTQKLKHKTGLKNESKLKRNRKTEIKYCVDYAIFITLFFGLVGFLALQKGLLGVNLDFWYFYILGTHTKPTLNTNTYVHDGIYRWFTINPKRERFNRVVCFIFIYLLIVYHLQFTYV